MMINNLSDVTLTPPPPASFLSHLTYNYQLDKDRSKSCYNTPSAQLLRGRGTECIKTLCQCVNNNGQGLDLQYQGWPGVNSDFGCPGSKEWGNIQQFCGPPQTQGFYNDGAWYTRVPGAPIGALAASNFGPHHIGPGVYSLGMYGA